MEITLPQSDSKEGVDYQKLKGLAIKLKKELDASKAKIKVLEQKLSVASNDTSQETQIYDVNFDQFAKSFPICDHKLNRDTDYIDDNAITNEQNDTNHTAFEYYCKACFEKAQDHIKAYNNCARESGPPYAEDEGLKGRLLKLGEEKRRLAEENQRLNGQVLRLHGEIGTMEDNKELIRVKDLEIEGFEKSLSNLKSSIQDKGRYIAELEQRGECLEKTLNERDEEIARITVEKECGDTYKMEQELRLKELEDQLSTSKLTVTTLSNEKDVLSEQLKEVKGELQQKESHFERENQKNNQEIKDLGQKNQGLRLELDCTLKKGASENANNQKMCLELDKCRQEHERYKAKVCQVLNKHTEKVDAFAQTTSPPTEIKNDGKCKDCEKVQESLRIQGLALKDLEHSIVVLEQEKRDRNNRYVVERSQVKDTMCSFNMHFTRLLKLVQNRQANFQTKLECYQTRVCQYNAYVRKIALEVKKNRLSAGSDLGEKRKVSNMVEETKLPAHLRSSVTVTTIDHEEKENSISARGSTERRRSRRLPTRRKRSLDRLIDDWLNRSENSITEETKSQNFTITNSPSEKSDKSPMAYEAQIAHWRELVAENEAQVRRLTEQVVVLKREIRRLDVAESLQVQPERLKGAVVNDVSYLHNLEYLKNVFYKFLSPETEAQQRKSLIPVLNTMLALTPPQSQALKHIASSQDIFSETPTPLPSQGYGIGSLLPPSFTSYLQR